MSKSIITLSLGALLLAPCLASAASTANSQDGLFVVMASQGGMTEIETSKLAKDRSKDLDIKAFAQRMIDDHKAVARKVASAASDADVYMPDDLDQGHQMEVDMLKKVSAADFDKTYLMIQDKEHREAVKGFEDEAKMGSDQGLVAAAVEALPTLQDHKRMVMDLEKKMTVTPKALPSMADPMPPVK